MNPLAQELIGPAADSAIEWCAIDGDPLVDPQAPDHAAARAAAKADVIDAFADVDEALRTQLDALLATMPAGWTERQRARVLAVLVHRYLGGL